MKRASVLLGLCAFTLLAAEACYRAYVARQIAAEDRAPLSYRVTPSVYIEFDERHGERFKPDSECWVSYVENGRLVWGTVISRSNRDGLGGRTTLDEYRRSPIKVLVFGESFTHWNQGGVTWPDLLQDGLRRALGTEVAVLNYARGAYGVLQMLDLAADMAEEHRPDVIVVAAISHDFRRARWWCKEVRKDGFTRWMMSTRPDAFLDYRIAGDEMLVHPGATKEWCRRRLAGSDRRGGPDAVLAGANAQFRHIRDEVTAVRREFDPWAAGRSYLLRRLTRGHPFAVSLTMPPEVDFDDFASDVRTRSNLRRLAATGIPLLFVYLPTAEEMAAREILLDRWTGRLMTRLERLAGRRFRLLQKEFTGPVPAQMNLLPYDAHPSREGLQLYADAVVPMVLEELRSVRDRPAAEP